MKMEEYIKDHLEDSQKIMEKEAKLPELVLQQIEQVMLYFIRFIKIMLKKEQIS